MKKFYIITVCIMLLSISSGCSLKRYHIDTSLTLESAAALTVKNTPNLCSYRGRAAISIEGQQNISFSILLNKKCNDDALINVLGALNNPLASIRYENKKLEVQTQNPQNTEDIKKIADKSIFHIISFFKTPQRCLMPPIIQLLLAAHLIYLQKKTEQNYMLMINSDCINM